MNFLKRPFVKSGIRLLLMTHVAGCDVLWIGDCTNQPFDPFGLPQGPVGSVQVTCCPPDSSTLRIGILPVDLLKLHSIHSGPSH
jgi:hypothetical protein